jgi:hypothetical protein
MQEMFKDFSFRYDKQPERFVLEYQCLDRFGHTVCNLTHLESSSLEILLRKMAECHSQAAAAVERLQYKLSQLEAKQEKQKQ